MVKNQFAKKTASIQVVRFVLISWVHIFKKSLNLDYIGYKDYNKITNRTEQIELMNRTGLYPDQRNRGRVGSPWRGHGRQRGSLTPLSGRETKGVINT